MVVTYSRSPKLPHPPVRLSSNSATRTPRSRPSPPSQIQSQKSAEKTIPSFIVNDHPDIAADIGADGVHVGQDDLSIADCREILQPDQIVGKSNALLDEAISSFEEGADYIAVGSIYETDTKSDTRPAGLSTLRAVSQRVTTPIVAIGGIKPDNIAPVAEAGADCVCVATAVTLAPNPADATRELVQRFTAARHPS